MYNFDLPTCEYFKFGNIFSSSFKNFNYKIFPNCEDDTVRVVVWLGVFCLDVSEISFQEEFKMEEDLKNKLKFWLEKV